MVVHVVAICYLLGGLRGWYYGDIIAGDYLRPQRASEAPHGPPYNEIQGCGDQNWTNMFFYRFCHLLY